MDLFIKSKVIIVTGGANGIGEAITRLLVEEGARAVVVDKDEPGARKLERAFPGQLLAVPADLHSADSCRQAVEVAVDKFGAIDGLVNNAGVNDGVGLEQGDPVRFDKSFTGNASHYYYMAHYCLPHLKKSKGSIVNMGSKTALTGQGNTSGYAGAKGAILAFTREWAAELLPAGIRVNAVIPAEVWTSMYETWIAGFPDRDKKLAAITSRIPLGQRMTTAAEIANMTVFLLSPRSSHTTGQWLHVDGGYVHLDRALP